VFEFNQCFFKSIYQFKFNAFRRELRQELL
jgi:hypothetical protein